jgi:hypothetical protein
METFIERNGGWTPEDIQRHHSSPEREFEGRDVCKVADVVEMYQAAEAAGPAATKKGTDELLAVPREPEMDPCL